MLTLLVLPGVWLGIRFELGMLGARPLNELIHGFGYWAVWFLLTSLMITPAKAIYGLPSVVVVRRMVGNAAWIYACIHLLLYIADQNWNLPHVASEIVLRFYLTIGFVTLLGLTALGITSTDGWARRLGRRWKQLHRIVYGLALLAVFHYALQVKADVSLPLLAWGVLAWLLIWRVLPAGRDRGPGALAGLSVLIAALTALFEWGWYRFATHIDPVKVLRTELDWSFGLHPAGQVLALGALMILALWVHRLGQGRAGQSALFWVVLFAAGAWVDDVAAFVFSLNWNDDWDDQTWLWQSLAWSPLLALLGYVRWLRRGDPERKLIDGLAIGCVAYQLVLALNGAPILEVACAAALAMTWIVLAYRTWPASRLAVAMLVPLALGLGYGVAGLL